MGISLHGSSRKKCMTSSRALAAPLGHGLHHAAVGSGRVEDLAGGAFASQAANLDVAAVPCNGPYVKLNVPLSYQVWHERIGDLTHPGVIAFTHALRHAVEFAHHSCLRQAMDSAGQEENVRVNRAT